VIAETAQLPAELASAVVEAAARWTVPFLVVWLVARGGWWSAAARHHLWALLLAGLVLLPFAAAAPPAVRLAKPAVLEVGAGGTADVRPALAEAAAAPVAPIARVEPAVRREGGAEQGPGERALAEAVPAAGVSAPARRPAPRAVLGWVWLAVAVGLLGYGVAGQVYVRLLALRCRPAPAARQELLRECARRLGIGRRCRLLLCDREAVPMTWGWLSPVVLLPAASAAWPDARVRRVLLHELAHVARADFLTQAGAGVACALFWFHPGVWYTTRALRREAEMACDDRVVEADGAPVGYAEDLLDIARALRVSPLAHGALPMARRGGLQHRVRRLLQTDRRRGLSRRLAALLALGVAAPVAAIAAVGWAEASGRLGERPRDWLRPAMLEDGRAVWTMDCGDSDDRICRDGTRRAVAMLEQTGRTGAVVAQRVATGEVVVYAAVRRPGSERDEAVPLVEPGSVAKLALAALWWEHEPGEHAIPCPGTTQLPSGRTLTNAGRRDFGSVSVTEMVVVSCNTAAITMATALAERMGADAFAQALVDLGFGGPASASAEEDTAFWAQGGTAAAWIAPPRGMPQPANGVDDALLLAALGIADGVTTPLHVSRFLQGIGNGGLTLAPRPLGGTPSDAAPARLLGETVAARLQQSMLRVVRDGTAARTVPQLEWSRWSLGGKTGTVPRDEGVLNGWFAGLAHRPDGGAEYTIVVLLEDGGTGGGAPAGIAAEMTRFFARAQGDEL
jgi:beta-lactamase regulating signal transducer with metallopeptidase domain